MISDAKIAADQVAGLLSGILAKARQAQNGLKTVAGSERNRALLTMASWLEQDSGEILAANQRDIAQGRDLSPALAKRLELTPAKLQGLAEGLRTLAALPDPVGRGEGRRVLSNGLVLETVRVPLGVIALIFESRPGVAVEAAGLAVKSGNAILLRGGREARESVGAIVRLWQRALAEVGVEPDCVTALDDPDRRLAEGLMHLRGLDLLIPRGGRGLIDRVVREATVPVIETGVGNCHLYVDRAADLDMAVHILADGKLGNPAVCNALETLLVHEEVAERFLPAAFRRLSQAGVTFHGDEQSRTILPGIAEADEEDFQEEYLGLDLAVGVVGSLEAALAHIDRFGTQHSEAIVTEDYSAGMTFLDRVDAAAVYWNASTRFTDGFEFGLGAEVGISTQKLHARGPMGLEALTTWKTVAFGRGQTRDL